VAKARVLHLFFSPSAKADGNKADGNKVGDLTLNFDTNKYNKVDA